jgi:Nif11 domain
MTEKTKKRGAKEFADLVDKDKKVREEVRTAAESIIDVAKKHGYKFTGREMQGYLKKKWGIVDPPTRPDCEDPKEPEEDQDGIMTTWCW